MLNSQYRIKLSASNHAVSKKVSKRSLSLLKSKKKSHPVKVDVAKCVYDPAYPNGRYGPNFTKHYTTMS